MRRTSTLLIFPALVSVYATPVHADPYRWCADYSGGRGGGGTNCYFMTIQQCRAAISGVGGFCRENGFYDRSTCEDPGRRPHPPQTSVVM
jgi:Protein of unknown function (DUF3551)